MERKNRQLSPMQEQLLGVKRKMRRMKKVTLILPSDFTFNRAGIKHFDSVLSWFKWDLQNIPVEIDFRSCSSANYETISLLILYCWKLKQQNCTVSFLLDDSDVLNGSRVWRMLGAYQLFGVATDPKLNFSSNEYKPIFAIRNSDDFKAATTSIEDFSAPFGIEYQETLHYVISELLYNVLEHGASDFFWHGHRFPTPSLVQFSKYERVNEIHFIVADIGIGIKRHLSQTYSGLASDEEAIRLAVQPEVSGTFGQQDPYSSRNNAGMGLYLSSSIARKLRGDMYICSGNGIVHLSPSDTTSKIVPDPWPGTFVLVTIRLDRGTGFALDAMMSEFRARAKLEVSAREDAKSREELYVNVYNYFGKRADVKSEAINYRNKYLMKAVQEGKTLILDFVDVTSSTHSFLNALLASPIKNMGLVAYKRIRVVNAKSEIRETIDYILDDNTSDSVSPIKPD